MIIIDALLLVSERRSGFMIMCMGQYRGFPPKTIKNNKDIKRASD
jgi:hypothetical protein